MKLGIIKEGKTPPDKRVPLSPAQCKSIKERYPDLELVVQRSQIRKYSDAAYEQAGIELVDDVSDCDVLLGVKEVPKDMLIAGKTYFFFSHTIKKQPYNRALLQKILDLNIRLIDWETLVDAADKRVIGFGRYAGLVGCYNGLLAYGKRNNNFTLKPAYQCEDLEELLSELNKVQLPPLKIVLTGKGRVGGGAVEILQAAGIRQVSGQELLENTYTEPVFAQLSVTEYNKRKDNAPFEAKDFYANPEAFEANFMPFAEVSSLYIACHYWDANAPFIFSRADAKSPDFNIEIVADISCDIDGPVASTLRPSTIDDPLYGYDPQGEKEVDFMDKNAIGVMAVDNLPCELPKDASSGFGEQFMEYVMPALLDSDSTDPILDKACIAAEGKLTERFAYLQDYVDGKA